MSSGAGNSTEVFVPCTLDTCPLSEGVITYQPNVGANAFFAVVFGLILVAQFYLGIRYKTWSYLVPVAFGLVLEIVGYAGRIQLHGDPFNFNFFVQYLVCLTIGPACLCAAIYVTFRRIVHSCDDSLSWIRPRITSIIFMSCDFICLVLQATGGAITSTSGGSSQSATDTRQTGVNIMIGGLAFQVVSMFFFMTYASIYAWRWHVAVTRRGYHPNSTSRGLRWKGLVLGLVIATITIFVRSAFRVAELRDGFESSLASNEVAFMILEGAMIIIASLALTIVHPGVCLNFAWKIPKGGAQENRDIDSTVGLESIQVQEARKG